MRVNNKIDLQVLELMASKLCHDLISPIGAVNNGVEFLEEMGADAGKDVTDLIAFSAAQASAKLQAFRMAYGVGGADSNIKPEDVHRIVESLIVQDNKIKQQWDPHASLGFDERPEGYCKILINTLMLAMECLPKGGTLKVASGSAAGETLVIAAGEDAGFRARSEEALNLTLDISTVEPKYVHAYVTGILAQKYGFKVARESNNNGILALTIRRV
jgi:histidine phosphotransferase ChpT